MSGWEISPGREAEATGMEAGAPRPAAREMGKAGFSIGIGRGSVGAAGVGCAHWPAAFHREVLARCRLCLVLPCPLS